MGKYRPEGISQENRDNGAGDGEDEGFFEIGPFNLLFCW
jgi:hypothetical protein